MAAMKQKYPTIRIRADTHSAIKKIAEEDGVSMSDVIQDAVEAYRRKRIAEKANAVWEEAMKDPVIRKAWVVEDRDIEWTFAPPVDEP